MAEVKQRTRIDINIKMAAVKGVLLNFIVPLISLSVTGLLAALVVYPMYKALPGLKTDVKTQSDLQDSLQSKLDNLKRLIDFQKVVSENSGLINKVLVSEPLVPQLLNQVDDMARSAGLDISKLSYSYGEEKKGENAYQRVTVSLSASGTYDQLVAFFKIVEQAARAVGIEDYRFSVDSSNSGVFSTSFSLYSPYLNVNSSAVTDDPVNLDIGNKQFLEFINKIKSMKFYSYSVSAELPSAEESTESTSSGSSGTE